MRSVRWTYIVPGDEPGRETHVTAGTLARPARSMQADTLLTILTPLALAVM